MKRKGEMKLLTRRQIIQIWGKQSDEILDSFCCPNCRDVLEERIYVEDNTTCLVCSNITCSFSRVLKSEVEKETNV